MEPATFGCEVGGSWVATAGFVWSFGADVGAMRLVLRDFEERSAEIVSELDLVVDDCRLCGVLLLVLVLVPGFALRLRPLRYSSAGFRKMPVLLWIISCVVPMSEDVTPVTGSQRWFSIKIGFER